MCVVAGYIGEKRAAPILLEMLKREEGLAGGFYAGIATIHEGELYYEKVVGDVDTLIRQTKAMELPGTIGIAHCRPPGLPNREHAHPFISRDGNLAYIVNGRIGKYENIPLEESIGNKLLNAGYTFRSAMKPAQKWETPLLKDGTVVHSSEIKCHEIAEAYNRLAEVPNRLRNAMINVYQEHPMEIVGLCLHAHYPDEIAVARHNLPLEIGRDNDGAAYLASTSIAFPATAHWQMRMAPNAGATFRRDGSIDILPFDDSNLLPMGDALSPTTIEKHICHLLRKYGPLNIPELFDEVDKLWADDVLGEKEIVTFETLAALLKEGRIKLEERRISGVIEGTTAPRFWVHWTDHQHSITVKSAPDRVSISLDKVKIRKATSADTEAIAKITGEAFAPMSTGRIMEEFFGAPLGGVSWEKYKSAEVAAEARDKKYFFSVAEFDGKIIGYASWNYDAQRDIATVGHNAVLPQYQKNGVGKKLQNEIISQLNEAGHRRWKVTTLAHDYPAQRIYEKMGFEEIVRSIVYLRKDPEK